MVTAACGGGKADSQNDSIDDFPRHSRGPDPIVIRIPREGGGVKAYLYPRLDSVIWNGNGTSVNQVMSFDPEGGTLTLVDSKGLPARVDLRFGVTATASKAKLSSISSIDGTIIYGIDSKGNVVRMTRSSDWSFEPPAPAKKIFPQIDGSLIVIAKRTNELVIWKMRPPETRLLDTIRLGITGNGVEAQVGDRVYFATDTGLVSIRTRDMSVGTPIRLKERASVLAPTPSGDRVYVAVKGKPGLLVVDRYTDQVTETISLPGEVSEIRMDPLGRHILARPLSGDSAWVIAISTNQVVGSVQSKWTGDLPASAPDGAIAISRGADVVFVDGETLQSVRTIAGGAKDYWYFLFWNGFRPSASRLADHHPLPEAAEEPAYDGENDFRYETDNSDRDQESYDRQSQDSKPPAPNPPPILPVETLPPQRSVAQSYTVSFAALLSSEKAHELANSIVVNGVKARVVESRQAGTPIYRVILGPYANRAMAEQIGRDSNRQFWVYGEEP